MNKMNDLFSVNVTQQNISTVTATFSFPNGLNGSAKCRVEYGISPNLNHSKQISCDANMTFELTIPGPAKVDSYYYYLASVITHDNQQCVYVNGSIRIDIGELFIMWLVNGTTTESAFKIDGMIMTLPDSSDQMNVL